MYVPVFFFLDSAIPKSGSGGGFRGERKRFGHDQGGCDHEHGAWIVGFVAQALAGLPGSQKDF